MPKQTPHPTNNELSAFALGDLPPDAAQKVERHVSECDTCCDTIVSLASDDTFVGMLQVARADASSSANASSPEMASDSGDEIPAPLKTHSRYEIKTLVGRGGMGRVYKARHRMMDRDVALKVIHREWVTKTEAIDRFRREMKSAASLDHPNIVTAHDAEQADDLHFLVMEYVDGIDLAQTVRQNGPLSIDDACEFIRQAAEGLQHAHERGMVHRDIKPHNLIVTKDNIVKILDFGLASLAPQTTAGEPISESADGNLTTAGAIMGTPDFISPEQSRDARAVDGRSDIYSLGMTLYYLIAGQVPFKEGTATEKLKQHAESEPTPLSNLRDDVPAKLQDIVERMTAKDPAARFQTPKEVASALSQLISVRPKPEPEVSSRLSTALKVFAFASVLVMTGVAALQFGGFLNSNTRKDEVHAPLGELGSYIQSMMSSPHDLIYLNVGDIGPDNNYLRLKPIQGGVQLGMPAFGGHLGKNRQGEYVEQFRAAAEDASLSIVEKSQLAKSGAIDGVTYSIKVHGDPLVVSKTIQQLVCQTFSVQLTESCDYDYRNLPAEASGKIGAGPQQISGTRYIAEQSQGQRVYYGEEQNWIYLAPANRLTDSKMQRDSEVWYANINELPSGFASQIRSGRAAKAATQKPGPMPGDGHYSISQQRLTNANLWFIRNRDVRWAFTDRSVEISNSGALLPYEFRKELADGANVRNITGVWALSDGGTNLNLSDLKLDGQPSTQELNLKVSAAGPIRVNIGSHQYNFGTPSNSRPGSAESVSTNAAPASYDFTRVPGNAAQVLGCLPQQILQDKRFFMLLNRPLPIDGLRALFVKQNVASLLEISMPVQDSTSDVYVVTVAEGSAMRFVDEILGLKDRPAVPGDTSRIYATHHIDHSGRLFVRHINQQTVAIGRQRALEAHLLAVQGSSNERLVELAQSLQGAQVFGIMDRMTDDEARQLIRWGEDFAFETVFEELCTIGKNSAYIGGSISLSDSPGMQFVSHADDGDAQQVVAEKIESVPNALQLMLQLVAGSGPADLNQEDSNVIDAALANADTMSSGLSTSLAVPFGGAQKPLLRIMNNLLEAERKKRSAAAMNIREIGLAFHNFHLKHGYFPSESTKLPAAKHPVSWRIAILPFLEQQELFEQYNLDEPWDSENNKRLLNQVPAVFRHPAVPQQGTNASHVVFVGETATGTAVDQVSLQGITDGTSRTILVAETATSIPWTKPEDVEFDLAKPLPPIGNLLGGGWHATLADGSVSFIPATTSVDVVKALLTRSGNEPMEQKGDAFSLIRPSQLSGQQTNAADKASTDTKNIIGTWQVTYGEDSGRIVPQEMMKNIQFSFTKDTVSAVGMGTGEEESYKLDPTTTPRSIDMMMGAEAASLGIYDLQGDTLRLCLRQGKGRPTQFDSNSESRNLILNLKRVTSTVPQSGSFTDVVARQLLPEAASMPFKEFEKIARSAVPPNPDTLASQSLTVVLLGLNITDEAARDFKFIAGVPKPSDIAKAITTSRWKGYASFIQPEYITACEAVIDSEDKNRVNGWVEFQAAEIYEGKVHFSAKTMADGKWKITEFNLPNANVTLSLDKDGKWLRSTTESAGD